ncbi:MULTISPECIES: transglutaminase domain-containing protein [unclassified Streptococcus]|uniref:transglutaminase domain-containing protein n=1 Tax=unclassified Streptococcus TaxID=2608887 RepID=UPI00359D7F68
MNKRIRYGLAALALSTLSLYPVASKAIRHYQQKLVRLGIAEQAKQPEAADDDVIKQGQAAVAANFYYQQLSKKEQADYIRLVTALRQFDTKSPFKTTSSDRLKRIYLAVTYDFPEFYWLSEQSEIDFSQLIYPKDAKETYQRVQRVADEVIAQMPDGSDYDKVKYLYEYVIQHTQYHIEALNNESLIWQDQSARSVFLEQESVCAGYSRAFQLLCQKAGLNCLYVAGDIVAYDYPHAWNLVEIDGDYYPVDTTWGDPTFESAVAGQDANHINYSYLCTPREIFERTHTAWTGFDSPVGEALVYPALAENALNYYVLNGSYFETYDETALTNFIAENVKDASVKEISFQMGNQVAYETAFSVLQSDTSPVHAMLGHLPNYQGYEFYGDQHTYQLAIKIPR